MKLFSDWWADGDCLSRFRLHHIFAVLLCICMSSYFLTHKILWYPVDSLCSSPLPPLCRSIPWSLRLLPSHHRIWNAGRAQSSWYGMNPFEEAAIVIVVLPTGRYETYSLWGCYSKIFSPPSSLPLTLWLVGFIFGNNICIFKPLYLAYSLLRTLTFIPCFQNNSEKWLLNYTRLTGRPTL